MDPKTWVSQELGPADGCDLRNFFIASRARTASGALLFGAPEGLLVVRPEEIAPWTYAPPVVATALRVDGSERDFGLYAAKRSGRNGWIGIEAGEAGDPKAALRRFRDNPETSLEHGEIRVHAQRAERPLRWA